MAAAAARKRSGYWIWVPFGLAGLLVAAYSAYWHVARGILETEIDAWIEAQRAQGATVEYAEKSLGGYPFRFDLTVAAPEYGAPDGPVWRGQELQLIMQPWDWYHIIARAPGRNTVVLAGDAEDALSLLLGPGSAGSARWNGEGVIERFSLSLDEASLALTGEPVGDIDGFQFHLRQLPAEPDTLQIETHWQRLVLSQSPGDELAILGRELGPSILRAELSQGAPAFARTGDLAEAIREALAAGGELQMPQLLLEWGPLSAGAKADLSRRSGALRGAASFRIERAADLRAALDAEGLLTDDARQALDALEAASADGGFLSVTLRGDGIYFLGNKLVDLPLGEYL